MTKIRLATELSVGLDVVTQTLAAIGRKGAGKTYLATAIAEQLLDAGAQVIAIDVVGNWWGLRVGADGRSPGKEIFVIGGEHGDVPLVPEAGAKIAQLLVEKRVSAVLDISPFSISQRKRFAWEFAEAFFQRKKTQRSPVHVFFEEAQLLIPQRVSADEARMVGAFESIVRLGRNYGIGATLVTQRPQSVNKEVLSQVECLCVLQVNGSHERKALEEWVQEAGADRKLVGELPGLGRGEGYVWSPSWLRVFKRVHFIAKTTFDASATPEVGKAAKAAKLSAVDVEALKSDLTEVVKQAEADDPKALRRRILELERELKQKAAAAPPKDKVVEKRVDVPVLKDGQLTRLEKTVERWTTAGEQLTTVSRELLQVLSKLHSNGNGHASAPRASSMPRPMVSRPKPQLQRATAPVDGVSRSQQQLLNALAFLETIGKGVADKTLLALMAGVSPTSGGYFNNLGALRTAGLLDYPSPGAVQLTEAGRAVAAPVDVPTTSEEMQALLAGKLSTSQQAILQELITVYPEALAKDELAKTIDVSPTSGGYFNNLGRLRSLGLVDYPSPGYVAACPVLFLEEA